jgi:hypothetical protein
MTKNTKLIVGAAVVIGALYLYNRSKNSSSEEGTSEFLGFGRRRRRGRKRGAASNDRVPCTNPTSMVNFGNPNDPCCTGTKNCRGTLQAKRGAIRGKR